MKPKERSLNLQRVISGYRQESSRVRSPWTHRLLLPRMRIRRKRKPQAEPELEPRHSDVGCICPKQRLHCAKHWPPLEEKWEERLRADEERARSL